MPKFAEKIPVSIRPQLRPALTPQQEEAVRAALDVHRGDAGALLPVMHAIQDALGYIPEGAVPIIAQDLNQSRAEVHGMLSFYHYFRTHPGGKHEARRFQLLSLRIKVGQIQAMERELVRFLAEDAE